ncbi:MAG: isoform [Herbinix sp.]|jgi:dienelactone hydrolase|nr:isoform [Herbinix sp.]
MIGIIILLVMLGIEVGFMVYCFVTKSYQKENKYILRVSLFVLLLLLFLLHGLTWGFRYTMLTFILLLMVIVGTIQFFRGKYKKVVIFKKKYVIMTCIRNMLLFTFAIMPAILFPQFKPIEITGNYDVKTVSYTLTDDSRKETFSDNEESRKVTIEFWYPDQMNEQYPLLVFSHGSFGFRGSNRSTFENLASNGYVVCSIDHTYHSFFTSQTDGKSVLVNMDFMNDAIAATNGDFDEQTTFQKTQEWLDLRTKDMNFVLDTIEDEVSKDNSGEVYQLINTDEIGLFGHSLGGATAARLGRDRDDIDAVIVVDGTMLGEELAFEKGSVVINKTPYPIPLLNMYNEEHYEEAKSTADHYANTVATAGAIDAKDIVIHGSGHLNFTDLPLFSPFLASMLGTGEVDSRYCIETMNQIILDYFNYYMKHTTELNLKTEY